MWSARRGWRWGDWRGGRLLRCLKEGNKGERMERGQVEGEVIMLSQGCSC